MKTYYAIHQIDKTHVNTDYDCLEKFDLDLWTLVQADSEGWIAHTGKECPLPDDARCKLMLRCGREWLSSKPQASKWSEIAYYRPILEPEKVQEPDYDPRSVSFKPKRLFDDLLERLEASHAAAQALPDLVAQLRDRLKPLGLSVMYLSEFDAVEPEAAVEPLQDNKYAAEW